MFVFNILFIDFYKTGIGNVYLIREVKCTMGITAMPDSNSKESRYDVMTVFVKAVMQANVAFIYYAYKMDKE